MANKDSVEQLKELIDICIRPQSPICGIGIDVSRRTHNLKINLSRDPGYSLPTKVGPIEIIYDVVGEVTANT